MGATITRQRKVTRVAQTAAELAVPLHTATASELPLCNVAALLRDAKPERRRRITEVMRMAFQPTDDNDRPVVFTRDARRSQYMHDRDVQAALGAEWVSSEEEAQHPTAGEVFAFTILEDKHREDGTSFQRRRFIGWPRAHNEWLKRRGYKADVPLEHVSAYLHAATDEFATSADCKVGFWQVEIPRECRRYFRGRTASGRLFQLSLLCMGQSPSVEIMQFVTEMVSGHPNSINKNMVISDARHSHTWVDGFRITAPTRAATQTIINKINDNARKYSVTLKEPMRVQTRYEFIGVEFDHERRRVRVAAKTRDKLSKPLPLVTTYGELEQFVGRIIFAAAVHQRPLVLIWFALKWVRRRLNWLNKGHDDQGNVIVDKTPCRLSEQRTVWSQLEQARRDLVGWHSVTKVDGAGDAHLFVDASKFGAGGVLLRPDGTIGVIGRAWKAGETKSFTDNSDNINICQLKAKAAGWAVSEMSQQLKKFRTVTLHVDNTSVQAAIKKGNARSAAVAHEVATLVQHMIPSVTWKVTRVASAENPADGPSRNVFSEFEKMYKQANEAQKENVRVGGGARVAFTSL